MLNLNLDPDERTLRQFGLIAVVGFGLLALAAWYELLIFHAGLGQLRGSVTLVLAGVGLVSAIFSWVAPRANRPLFVGLSVVSYPIGWIVSNVVLTLLFFGLFVPIGLALRGTGRDPLERERDATKRSYWVDARPTRSSDSYFKQF
jgi:hypothetical protein